jgi:hypothetical protein
MRIAAMLLLLSGALLVVAGCGGKKAPSPAAVNLRREDLIVVSRALKSAERPVAAEVAAAKVAWPLVANGVPPGNTATAHPAIAAAAASAAKIKLPALLEEDQAASITGPASQLGGLLWTFDRLATRGWTLIGASLEQVEHGSPAGARFARENVGLYIESVYDGHFVLAQIGKQLRSGYSALGGPAAFGSALTQGEVDALAATYSEPSDRLYPHVGARLGS